MKVRIVCFILLSFLLAAISLSAQSFEVSPYAGFFWPGNNSELGKFESSGAFGVRGGVHVTPNLEVGGNFFWSNRFEPSISDTAAALAGVLGFAQDKTRANLWEGEFTYHFASRRIVGRSVKPYGVLGFGALSTKIKDGDQLFVLNVRQITKPCGCIGYVANDVMENGDKYFAFSYGGGVKGTRLWGPMGFFGDFRGRTLPNFFGHGTTWPELSAGLNFSWGER